ncbi:hypothetical protein ACFX2H_036336 [Malus domestica]
MAARYQQLVMQGLAPPQIINNAGIALDVRSAITNGFLIDVPFVHSSSKYQYQQYIAFPAPLAVEGMPELLLLNSLLLLCHNFLFQAHGPIAYPFRASNHVITESICLWESQVAVEALLPGSYNWTRIVCLPTFGGLACSLILCGHWKWEGRQSLSSGRNRVAVLQLPPDFPIDRLTLLSHGYWLERDMQLGRVPGIRNYDIIEVRNSAEEVPAFPPPPVEQGMRYTVDIDISKKSTNGISIRKPCLHSKV